MNFNAKTSFTIASKVRGGKYVWVKNAGKNQVGKPLAGYKILNPYKGFGYSFAADLVQIKGLDEGNGYTECYLFKSFIVADAVLETGTSVKIKNDGYSCIPEVGNMLMVAPSDAATTGQSTKVTAVSYDSANSEWTLTIDTALGVLSEGNILVEAAGSAASATASVLCDKPNTFIETDIEWLPTDGSYGLSNVNHYVDVCYDREAYIARMQPIPAYVKSLNKSYIPGVFEL